MTGLTNGTTYYFTFFTRKGSVWSTGVSTTATPNFMSQASDYFRSIASGSWFSTSTWQSSSDNNTWISATLTPTSSANTIIIQNGHTVSFNGNLTVDQLIVESGAVLEYNSSTVTSFVINDGIGDDFVVYGKYKINLTATATTTINGTAIVKNGGMIEVASTSGGDSRYIWVQQQLSNKVAWETGSIYYWVANATFGTSNITYFPDNGTIPIFRIKNTGANTIGSANPLIINGKLEVETSGSTNFGGTGLKTIKYGIIGAGDFNQIGGIIQITGVNAEIGGTGTIALNSNGLTISSGAEVYLTSNKTFSGSGNKLTVSGILDCDVNAIAGDINVTVNNGGVLKTANLSVSGAISGTITATGGLTLNTGSTVELNGATQQFLGARTFSNLKINNISGVLAKGDITVNGILDLATANPNATNGTLEMVNDYTGYAQNPYGTGDYTNSTASFNNLDSYVLTMGPSATTVGIGDVTGKIRRTGLVDNTTYSFGNAHTELRLNSVSGSAIPSQITVVATRGAYGTHIDNTGGVAINGNTANRNAVQRLYQVLRTGGDVASRFTLRMAYEDTELNGNAEANLVSWDHHLPYGAITPHEHGKTSANATENWVELSNHSVNYLATEGATAFTKYWMLSAKESLNDYEWLGAVAVPGQTNWNITDNWKSGKIPNEAANVFIPNAALTANDPVINSDSGYGILDGTSVTAGEVRMRSLEIASGGVLTVASGTAPTITLYGGPNVGGGGVNYGSWLNNGTFTAENSTVVFDFDTTATESTIAGSTTFNNLTIANGKKATIQEDAQVAIAGTLTNGGVLDATTNLNTVIFNGSADQTVVATNGSDLAYYSLELGGTGVKSFAATPSIKGNFIQSGSASITVPSTITFNGSAAQNIVGLDYTTIVFSEAGTKTFTSDGSISRAGAITFSGTPGTVDFDGISNNLNFVLKSDDLGTARIGTATGWTLNGKVTAERYIPAKRAWRLLTAPLKGTSNTTVPNNWQGVADEGLLLFSPSTYQSQTMTGYTTGGGSPNIWKYDSANTQWQSIPDLTNENLFTSTVNNGFLVFATGPSTSTNIATGEAVTTLRPKGQLIAGDVSHSLTADQYHLFGNPFASPLDTEVLVQANANTKVFMVDPSLGTVGGYVTYDGANWVPTPPSGSEKYIQSGQGFFVRSASNPLFTISESHKVEGNSNAWFSRTSASASSSSSSNSNSSSNSSSSVVVDKIRVLLYKQLNSQWQLADGILAVNSVGGNDGVDAVDTGKMSNFNENISFRNGTNNLAIEYRGLPTTGTVQPMRLTGTTVQPYQLRVKTEHYSNSDLQPYLEDTQTGTLTLIPTDGSEVIVSFTGVAATVAAPDTRFRIVYPSALGVDAPEALAVGVYPNPTEEGMFTIVLPSAGETARYTLTNLLGQEVRQGTLDSVASRVSVSSLQAGVYLLEVNLSGKRFTTKLIIK
ncbi:MAG: T9SS type A sorting domain-containing protein [Flavobacteriaceae bacterium]|nr:MAG: T9SS type A sorting domain-containing protein [Flavobacteriaceae bacterium]